METSEIYGAHGIPIDKMSLTNEIQQVLHVIGKHKVSREIKQSSVQRYDHRFIKQVN